MGRATIIIEDDGSNVAFYVEFDPKLEDNVKPSLAQVMAIEVLNTLKEEGLEKAMASSAKSAEGQ